MDVRMQKVRRDAKQRSNFYFEARLLLHHTPARGQKVLMKFNVTAGQTPFAAFERCWLPPAQQKLVTVKNQNGDDRNRISVKHEVTARVRAFPCLAAQRMPAQPKSKTSICSAWNITSETRSTGFGAIALR